MASESSEPRRLEEPQVASKSSEPRRLEEPQVDSTSANPRRLEESQVASQFTSLKKMVNLTELELVRCDLERILHSICSLHNLQEIDLKDNNLKTIEEIISFQHLHCLVCLKLWYNQIAYIPIQIGTLTNLKRLYLNRNKIEKIPSQLFSCHKLCFLDLSHNNLTSIHPEVGFLKNLQYLAVTQKRKNVAGLLLPLQNIECVEIIQPDPGRTEKATTLPQCHPS
uniref:Uncharacterized protein n=1 Tax=Oryzias latipes TaxID=8090 RepID=A0A3P9JI79_ORYLA